MSEQSQQVSGVRDSKAPDSKGDGLRAGAASAFHSGASHPETAHSGTSLSGNSVFWGLWIGDVLSTTGGYINDVGATWLMTALTTSPLMIALIQVVSNAPFFILALPSGALGDILDKRRLLLVAQIVMMVVSALLGVLTVLGVITPGSLLVLLFLIEAFDALAGPAWQTVNP
jgi:hypothetical protein